MFIAPSVLATDFTRLKEEIDKVQTAHYLHLDIMDGHFVPNISFGPDVVAQLRPLTNIQFDVHLMISNPLKYLEKFAAAGADIICFHIECDDNTEQVIKAIKALGKKAAIAVKPGTDIELVYPYVDELFMVLVMSVEPGFGGQSFMPEQMEKVKKLKAKYPKLLVEVDGGINRETIATCKEAGVDISVAGTAVFAAANPKEEIEFLSRF